MRKSSSIWYLLKMWTFRFYVFQLSKLIWQVSHLTFFSILWRFKWYWINKFFMVNITNISCIQWMKRGEKNQLKSLNPCYQKKPLLCDFGCFENFCGRYPLLLHGFRDFSWFFSPLFLHCSYCGIFSLLSMCFFGLRLIS